MPSFMEDEVNVGMILSLPLMVISMMDLDYLFLHGITFTLERGDGDTRFIMVDDYCSICISIYFFSYNINFSCLIDKCEW